MFAGCHSPASMKCSSGGPYRPANTGGAGQPLNQPRYFSRVLVDLLGDQLQLAEMPEVHDLVRRLGVEQRHPDRGMPAVGDELHAFAVIARSRP